MERLHLLGPSPSDLARLPSYGHHVARAEYLENEGYARFFKKRAERGEHVFLPVYRSYGPEKIQELASKAGATTVFLQGQPVPFSSTKKDVRRMHERGLKAVVVLSNGTTGEMEREYEKTLDADADGVGLPVIHSSRGDGRGRFDFIRYLVGSKRWRIRASHYLYELENPGELAVYTECLSPLIRGGIRGFVSERCYIDSRHGITYSPGRGLLAAPLKEFPEPYEHYQQYVLFDLNDETMKAFILGVLGSDIVREFREDDYVSRRAN